MSAKRSYKQAVDAAAGHNGGDESFGNDDGFIRSYNSGFSANRALTIEEQRRQLPAYAHRMQLLYAIENHSVVVVVGEPGSGKSTQLPQYLHEAGWADNGKTIGCTQPRRIAAAMLAQRVSQEMGVDLGTTVGYSVRFSDAFSPETTRIKYLTDGTLIRECLADPLLSAYSVIMVDEAQDHSIATHLLLALLKKILRRRKDDLRVVISSASLDAERFKVYFDSSDATASAATAESPSLGSATIMSISGRLFPVDTHYLATPCENYLSAAVDTVLKIHTSEPAGDILVFLPGKDDIAQALADTHDLARNDGQLESMLLLPLSAGLSAEEQRQVFDPAPGGKRKVVFSTNVAETSVTIDGIVYVVDCGFVKQRVFDPTTGTDKLVIEPTSKSSATQRAGRAGRTRLGKVYRLYTYNAYRSGLFLRHDMPEIHRLSLAPMVLTLMALGVSNLVRFDYFQSPPPELLSHALEHLASLGAIEPRRAVLTPEFGIYLAELPLDPKLGVCLLSAAQRLGCVREAVAAVAMLAIGDNPFVVPSGQRAESEADKRDFMVQEGDVLTFVNVLVAYQETPAKLRPQWCRTHFFDSRTLEQAARVSRQLESYLHRMGYSDTLRQSCGRDFSRLQKCLVSGLFANAAKLEADGSYRLLRGGPALWVHPSSVLFPEAAKPQFVVFAEAMETTKLYMRGITAIDSRWLAEVAPHYYAVK
ncbi:hypothetical protein GGI20_003660 [Coemansia sp. BCRC 34301]|nr:hypothetical protein GGI20_003660 [Coemansia sp. BCRC 34301]